MSDNTHIPDVRRLVHETANLIDGEVTGISIRLGEQAREDERTPLFMILQGEEARKVCISITPRCECCEEPGSLQRVEVKSEKSFGSVIGNCFAQQTGTHIVL